MALNRVSRVDDRVPLRNVLLSVSDKSGLGPLVEGLLALQPKVRFFSTGGTYAQLQALLGERAQSNLVSVSTYTGQPEMQGGLVKTLDFKIYMGLLSETYNDEHRSDLHRTGSEEFDLVIVNLYPFRDTISAVGVTLEDARANIDIGGPCMLRASAKNFLRVASICDPTDYPNLLEDLKKNHGATSLSSRLNWAKKTFGHTAAYDTAIFQYLSSIKSVPNGLYQTEVNA